MYLLTVGVVLLMHLITLGDTPHFVGLLWTRCRPFAETVIYTTHKIHNRQISVPSAGFEPAIPASERPQNHSVDRAATAIGTCTADFTYLLCTSLLSVTCPQLQQAPVIFLNSVPFGPSYQPGSHWMDFLQIRYWGFSWKSVEKIQVCLKSDKNIGNVTWKLTLCLCLWFRAS